MALSRDSRMDRRRRVLLDASSAQQLENSGARRPSATTPTGEAGVKKSAGYSQDVRQACGTRLVQLIPVRRRSFIALVVTSILITSGLLLIHYLVYVNGRLPWYGHPLAITVDLAHPQSIASWLGSHLWLLCLGTTILTFQLRRHKLDDYNGEYRLWFWLVVTCVLASIDSTTHISELFGMGLDKWSRANIGWSGKAVVLATMSTLIGMLGLRLCSELKAVPLSLVCWLIGLAAWAGSAALAQEMLLLDIAVQTRFWLRASLWLGGLTSIWIAAVAFLRYVYMDAQRRFLARGPLARRAAAIPLGERMRQSIPFVRRKKVGSSEETDSQATEAARWSLRRVFGRRAKPAEETALPATRRPKPVQPVVSAQPAAPVAQASNLNQQPAPPLRTQPAAGPLSAANRSSLAGTSSNSSTLQPAATPASPKPTIVSTPSNKASDKSSDKSETAAANSKSRWPFGFKLWPGKDVPAEEASEYRKIRDEERERLANERKQQRETAAAEKAAAKQARQAERESTKQSQRDAQNDSKPTKKKSGSGLGKRLLAPVAAVGSALKKIKLPSLAAFKLNPPEGDGGDTASAAAGKSSLKPAAPDKALPGTSRPGSSPMPSTSQQRSSSQDNHDDDDEDADDDRQLSKADRKKLRRQNRAA